MNEEVSRDTHDLPQPAHAFTHTPHYERRPRSNIVAVKSHVPWDFAHRFNVIHQTSKPRNDNRNPEILVQ